MLRSREGTCKDNQLYVEETVVVPVIQGQLKKKTTTRRTKPGDQQLEHLINLTEH